MNLETLAPYLLPLAMGLAGAALYHLIGPMLRYTRPILGLAILAVISPVIPLVLVADWIITGKGGLDIIRDIWEIFVGCPWRQNQECPEAKPTDDLRANLLRCNENNILTLSRIATALIRLDAIEERMGKVEEQLEPTPLRFTNPNTRFYPYAPYGAAGKPCPKPTKDLRPGDEVSVKAIVHMVGENEVDLAYLDAHTTATGPMRRHLVTLTYDEFDAMRTDNK